jgi:hypothetical protein
MLSLQFSSPSFVSSVSDFEGFKSPDRSFRSGLLNNINVREQK